MEGRTFWLRQGSVRVAALAPAGTTAPPGARADVTGTVEREATGAVRVRASRIETR